MNNNNNRFITKSNDYSTATAFNSLTERNVNGTRTVNLSGQFRSSMTYSNNRDAATTMKYRTIFMVFLVNYATYAYDKINQLLSKVHSSMRSKRLNMKQFRRNRAKCSRRQLSWNNEESDDEELSKVDTLRSQLKSIRSGSRWLREVTDVELLRFLRAKHGHVDDAFKMIEAHVVWRSSQYGADSDLIKTAFVNSPLRHEIFWLGLNKENCPTLVIRTQVHDGLYYNQDPKVYTGYVVSLLEQGRKQYSLGIERPLCILIDRGGQLIKNGHYKIDGADFSVVPRLVELMKHFSATMENNYPDLLYTAKIAPSAWFFSMCYKIVSRAMDDRTRARFQTIDAAQLRASLHKIIHPNTLPAHLGGTSSVYTSSIFINTVMNNNATSYSR